MDSLIERVLIIHRLKLHQSTAYTYSLIEWTLIIDSKDTDFFIDTNEGAVIHSLINKIEKTWIY